MFQRQKLFFAIVFLIVSAVLASSLVTNRAAASESDDVPEILQRATPLGNRDVLATRIAEAVEATIQAIAVEATVEAITTQSVNRSEQIDYVQGILPPELLSPPDGIPLDSARIRFEWKWHGELEENMGFEVRGWLEDEPHNGIHDARHTAGIEPDLRGVYSFNMAFPNDFRGKYWYWTVAVVQLEPYERIGPEAEPFHIRVPKISGNGSSQPESPLQQPESPLAMP